MNILFLGDDRIQSTTRHRAEALRRLGHEVHHFNPEKEVAAIARNRLVRKFHYLTGYGFIGGRIQSWLRRMVESIPGNVDLTWVNGGQHFTPACVKLLKASGGPVVLYNNDDPTGSRDFGVWRSLLKSIPDYDLCVTRRKPSEVEMLGLGAKKVIRVWMSYDEVRHAPVSGGEMIDDKFDSDVTFVGAWIPGENRHVILRMLHDAGFKVKIWGDHWQKSPDKPLLDACWQGTAISGRDYVHAIAGARISLGLLSHGNRDQHTRRSVEIPYCGGLLCAERTEEHLELYQDGREAVFWRNYEECLEKCSELLNNEDYRKSVRDAGMRRVKDMKVGNESICQQVFDALQHKINS